ncbi:MAG TPA: methyltransferase domain-containing protein [Terriglobales bacterium]|nr:methyltransferase domain-containing protein [Terriglobales bacterium]
MKRSLQKVFRQFGYEVRRIAPGPETEAGNGVPWITPQPIDPIWPLPRRSGGLSDAQIREEFAKFDLWHYAYAFEGGLSFPARHHKAEAFADAPERPLQRFRHFMPYLIAAEGGSLRGKRVLDIACNSGFWSIQCALLGAEVVGFDGRPELIEQAALIKSIVGVSNVQFKVLDFWDISPQVLEGTFDVVLNLGILYHLAEPLKALQLTGSIARDYILLDTEVYPSREAVVKLRWEQPTDIRKAIDSGIVANPSKGSIGLMLRHLGFPKWFEVPLHTSDMPRDYLDHKRASWLIQVRDSKR